MWECRDLQQQERAPRHRAEQGCIAGWEPGEGWEQNSRLWKEEVLGGNFSGAEAQLLTEFQVYAIGIEESWKPEQCSTQ